MSCVARRFTRPVTKIQLSSADGDCPQLPDEAFLEKARTLRPFYFIVVVWGERYTDFLLNFCIPALLSPHNIPALANRGGNKFLVATTDEDWKRMQPRPIFQLLKQYVEPVFIRIPPCPEGVSHCIHMGVGHKLATHMAFEDRAYGVLLTPDLMVSDGTMAAAQSHAVNGVQVVLTAALRFAEEPLFEHLEKLGIVAIDSRFGDEARPLVATGRQLVWAGIRSFHSETLCYEWEKPYFAFFPPACWWRVPEEDGIIVHSLSWAPLLVDYDAVEHHDSSMMDHWTIDGDYVYQNFGLDGKVHVVQDSDEIMLVSWAPLSDREQPLKPKYWFTNRFIGEWAKGMVLYDTLRHPFIDLLKRNIFVRPVYWHARDINPKWGIVERKALGVLRKFGLHPDVIGTGVRGLAVGGIMIARTVHYVCGFFFRFVSMVVYYWIERRRVLGIAIQAIKGDPAARTRVKRSFRYFVRWVTGLPITRG